MANVKRKATMVSLIRQMKEKGSWTGENHIQKCTYFLEKFLNVPLNFNFILYKHSPFSFDLRDELTALRADNYIAMEPRRPYGASFIPGKVAEVLEEKYKSEIEDYEEQINFIVEKLANKSVKELEQVATALYVKKNENVSEIEMVGKIHELKPHISKELAKKAVEELNNYIQEAENNHIIL